MAPFSILKKSPRGRKGTEQQESEDDVKIPNDTPPRDDGQRNEADDSDESAARTRRGFNKDLLHNLRSILKGKPPSPSPSPRGTAEQQPQQGTSTVRTFLNRTDSTPWRCRN